MTHPEAGVTVFPTPEPVPTGAGMTGAEAVKEVWALPYGACDKAGRLLLAVLASYVSSEPGHHLVWPAVETLAAQVGDKDPATTRRTIRRLKEAGLLIVTERPGTSNLYTSPLWTRAGAVPEAEVDPARPRASHPARPRASTPRVHARQTTNEHQDEQPPLAPATHGAGNRDRRRELFDALKAACGVDPTKMTKSERATYNAAVAELDDVGAGMKDVAERTARYRTRWPQAHLTPRALVKHWGTLAEPGSDEAFADNEQGFSRDRRAEFVAYGSKLAHKDESTFMDQLRAKTTDADELEAAWEGRRRALATVTGTTGATVAAETTQAPLQPPYMVTEPFPTGTTTEAAGVDYQANLCWPPDELDAAEIVFLLALADVPILEAA